MAKDVTMAYRINERNIGHTTIGSDPKKQRLTSEHKEAVTKVLKTVYNAMEFDDVLDNYSDGGRVCLMLDPVEMMAIRLMIRSLTNEQTDKNNKY